MSPSLSPLNPVCFIQMIVLHTHGPCPDSWEAFHAWLFPSTYPPSSSWSLPCTWASAVWPSKWLSCQDYWSCHLLFQPMSGISQLPWVMSEEPWSSGVWGQLVSGHHPCWSCMSVVLSLWHCIPFPDSWAIFHLLGMGGISCLHLPYWLASGSYSCFLVILSRSCISSSFQSMTP